MNEGMTSCGKPSRGRYSMGCRCYMCRAANAEYSLELKHREKGCKSTAMVKGSSVSRARSRVQGWLDDGHTLREVCRATGVPLSSMKTLLRGKHEHARIKPNGKPYASKRMSRKNYDAIMKCKRIDAPMAQTLVDATSLNAALAYLYERGVTPYQVAKVSGIPHGTVYKIGKSDKCMYKTLERLAKAAEELKAVAG